MGTAAAQDTSSPLARPLATTNQGAWQVIQLPLNWRLKNLKAPRPREVAVALLSPSTEDISSDNAPCGPPQSVVLIATSDTGHMRTRVLHKGAYCSSAWQPPAGLSWVKGPRVFIESIAVALQSNGNVEITYAFRQDASRTDTAPGNVGQSGTWKQVVAIEQIRALIESH